ncbi:hypothetical protein [Spirosoma utsteinense]|uniref:hypothetical protein n=1 Tax=Spirosoma utsteinense TaxID=2585773 RepID=UPI0016474FE8|nr:hypothetical protein [Spirosoma utsteinense]MBC3785720.1 hypothetical protein [Spirosoma utsteinense]
MNDKDPGNTPQTQMSQSEINAIHDALAKQDVADIKELKELFSSLDEAERNEPLGEALQLHIMRLTDALNQQRRAMRGFNLAID